MSEGRLKMKVLYTKEELIEKLQQLAENLGKTPTKLDVEIEDDFPSISAFLTAFGSFNNALVAANLKLAKSSTGTSQQSATALSPNASSQKTPKKLPSKPSKLSDKQFLELLRLKALELGHSPTWIEITLDQRFPSPATLARKFGTYNNAILAAGLRPNEYHKRGKNHHSPRIDHQKAP